MGWYITCGDCGKTGKYGYDCICNMKRYANFGDKLNELKGTTIVGIEYDTTLNGPNPNAVITLHFSNNKTLRFGGDTTVGQYAEGFHVDYNETSTFEERNANELLEILKQS